MASSSEGSSSFGVGLNNPTARETSTHSPNLGGKRGTDIENQPAGKAPQEKARYHLWPAVKKAASAVGRHTSDLASSGNNTPDLGSNLTMSPTSPTSKDLNPHRSVESMMKKYKEGALTRRRKISVPELGLGLMTTVQETHMDSPTIPGRFPVHERSNSAPGTSMRREAFEENMLESVAEPNHLATPTVGSPKRLSPKPSPLGEERKSLKRASSVLLPDELSVLPLPMSTFNRDADSIMPSEESPDAPPAVPPKSPRTLLRILPLAPVLNTKESQSFPQTQTLTPTSATEPSVSPSSLTASSHSPVSQDTSPKPLFSSKSPHHKQGDSLPVNTKPKDISIQASYENMSVQLKRQASEASMLHRGRSTRQVEGLPTRNLTVTRRTKDHMRFSALPPGVSANDAASLMPRAEVEQLQLQAIGQAERFEVLKYDDVKKLSQELRLLDSRCDYLRETHNSLRSGRRNLHARMITYLKSPRLSKFSRESMLKQEEALAELDYSIDEWVAKLEQADNRRTRVRQKLLEHVAAALTLQTTKGASSPPRGDETPPTSPEKSESPRSIDRETVHIYADQQLLSALFEDIEMEIEQMVEPRSAS